MKKAFTLIEVLSVIIILGVIGLIVTPVISNIIKTNKEGAYQAQLKEIEESASKWAYANIGSLPDGENETIVITLYDLKVGGHISLDVRNPITGELLDDNIKITIVLRNDQYVYYIEGKDTVENNENSPSVTLNGNFLEYIEMGSIYQEKSAKAVDNLGKEISVKIQYRLEGKEVAKVDTSKFNTYTVFYSATSSVNGVTYTSHAIRTIIIRDTTPPVLNIPDNIIISLNDVETFNLMTGVTVSDNSGETISVKTTGYDKLLGKKTVTYWAIDGSGNKVEKKRIIEIVKETTNLISTLMKQYSSINTVGLLKDGDNYYYKGTNSEVANNFVWYEGHLWRVIQINSDNTITMVTQQPITVIQPATAPWTTQAEYNSSYINTWLNNVFYNSISDKSKIKQSTFNVGIYTNVSEITTTQHVGLLDETQYTRVGLANSFLDIKDYFWLGNRDSSSGVRFVYSLGSLSYIYPTYAFGSRPVIKISDLTITGGNGTLSDPFRETKTSTNTSNVKVGEYISVPGSSTYCSTATSGRCLFRVVSKDSNSVKVILNGLLPTTSQFGSTNTFSNTSTINTPLSNFANSISTTYRYSGNKTFNIGMYEDGANYTVVSNTTYSGNVGLPVVGELFSGNDIDLSDSTVKAFVNGSTIENSTISSSFWTMNAYSSNVRFVNDIGYLHYNNPADAFGSRPVLYLNLGTNSNLTFTKGDGTAEQPYYLGN